MPVEHTGRQIAEPAVSETKLLWATTWLAYRLHPPDQYEPIIGSGTTLTIVRANTTKAKLRDGTLTLGAVITSPAAEMVEIAAVAGFDFVTFDAEHEPLDDAQLVELIRVADAAGITPIVRVAKDGDRILRLLDAGAQGIHAPRCSTPGDMRQLVQWTQFHPRGERTFYRLGRGGHYGRGLDDDTWAAKSNAELLVVAMIEEAAALDHLDELLAVPNIDAIHIGPKDLWQSMGMPPAPVVEAAVSRIATAVRAAGKYLSLQLRSIDDIPPQINRAIARQANMISVPLGGLLLQASEALIRQARDIGGAAKIHSARTDG
ncbi:MAG: 4-hydroxy-2-oxoheptanedioate aldolase [Acetobacteraceae bacterium]|nr:4-hydroxy-2-oxoheptanedioate aldolase [Acetobacteraceae bacterium]